MHSPLYASPLVSQAAQAATAAVADVVAPKPNVQVCTTGQAAHDYCCCCRLQDVAAPPTPSGTCFMQRSTVVRQLSLLPDIVPQP